MPIFKLDLLSGQQCLVNGQVTADLTSHWQCVTWFIRLRAEGPSKGMSTTTTHSSLGYDTSLSVIDFGSYFCHSVEGESKK